MSHMFHPLFSVLHTFQGAEYCFHAQRGGHGAQHTQHVNGFSIVRKKQISAVYASRLASSVTIKIVRSLCSVHSAGE